MQGNGNDFGFEWLFARRLGRMEAQGAPQSDVDSLKKRGIEISQALNEFRSQRRTLGDSGRFSREGLQEAISEQAAIAAGAIRRSQDTSVLLEHIKRTKDKLTSTTKVDPAEALVDFWKKMEIRTIYDRRGVSIINPATGELTFDTVKANLFYREAMARGDTLAMESLEEWLLVSPVDAGLLAEGRARRFALADPINSKKLTELERFKEAMENSTNDALQELREYLPQPDPIAIAAGVPDDAA